MNHCELPSTDFSTNRVKKSCTFCSIIILRISGFLILSLVGIIFILYQCAGQTKLGATLFFERAMNQGNGRKAVFWGEEYGQSMEPKP